MHPEPSVKLRIQFLGAATLNLPGKPSTALAAKDAVLLAHLALHGAGARDALAALLWQDKTPAAARTNLRQRIKRLQDASDQQLLALKGDTVSLGSNVDEDLSGMVQALEASPQAIPGPLLGSLQLADSPLAATWLDNARQQVHATRLHTLQVRANALEEGGRLDDALAYTARLLSEEPLHEHGHRQLMRLHYRRGEKAAALAAFERLKKLLAERLGEEPDAQTMALVQLIRKAEAPAPPEARAQKRAPSADASVDTRRAHASPGCGSDRGATSIFSAGSAVDSAVWAALMRPPRLLQREGDWQQLSTTWARGGTCIVLGEAGMGKTRLLNDFADSVGLQLRLQAKLGDHAVPFALLSRWVAAQLPAAQALPEWARSELARLVPELGSAPAGNLSPVRLTRALALLKPSGDAALIDDLHFADEASLALLPTVLQGLRCSLLGARQDEMPQPLRAWLQQTSTELAAVHLVAWNASTLGDLLDSMGLLQDPANPADESHPRDHWEHRLHRHTAGHPLLVLETLRAWHLGAGRQTGDWGRTPAELPTPPRVVGMLRQRLRRLSVLAQDVARLAAVAGEFFSVELAAAALHARPQELARAWAELQHAALMTPEGSLHDLVLQAAKEDLTEPLRRHLSEALATHLVERQVSAPRIAAAWAAAGKPEQAAEWHEKAVEWAKGLSRRADVLLHWKAAEEAWNRAARPDRAFRAGVEHTEALVSGGFLKQAVERALHLQGIATSDGMKSQAARLHAMALAFMYDHAGALERATAAHSAAVASGNDEYRVDALVIKAVAAASLNQTELAQACIDEEQQIAPNADDWQRAITRLAVIGNALTRMGRIAEALERTERSIQLADRAEARTEQMLQLSNSAHINLQLGIAAQAAQRAQQAVQVAAEIEEQDGMLALNARMNLALAHTMRGMYQAALGEFEVCEAGLGKTGVPRMLGTLHHHLARAFIHLGQWARAQQMLNADEPGLTPTHRARRWTLQLKLHQLCGAERPPADPALKNLDPATDATVAAWFRLAEASHSPDELRLATAQKVAGDMRQMGLAGAELAARVAALSPLSRLQPGTALAEARNVLAQLHSCVPQYDYLPDVLWEVHQALFSAGAVAEAQAVLEQAWTWIRNTHDKHVPPALRDAFLRRNRVNADIAQAWRKSGGKTADGAPP